MLIASYAKYEELRNKTGVTDYRVATDTGISKSTFSEWKGGNRVSRPKVDKLAKLATYFNVPIDYFFQDDQEESGTGPSDREIT